MSSWDPVWEELFRARASWGRYPPEELVRFMARHYYGVADRRAVRVLELGCGPGGGPAWYLAREGFTYAGIDGSATAIERAQARFAADGLAGQLVCGGLEPLPWPDGAFDCVVDVCCLQHNAEAPAAAIVGEVERVLAPGGRHFSITIRGCPGEHSGRRIDGSSFADLSDGPLAHLGVVRFATREQLRALYGRFTDVEIDHSIRSYDDGARELAHWIVTCKK